MKNSGLGVAAAFLVLTIRGFLLWFLVPIGAVVWFFSLEWVGKKRLSLGAYLGWLDNNLAYLLVKGGPLSSLFPAAPVKWVPASERFEVTHRIGFADPL